jgi:hypothetical protein
MVRLLALLALALVGCIPPQSQTERLTNSAYDVVMAARFGRMDIVIDAVKPEEREAFAAAHAEWGNRIRIVDIEFGGARIVEQEKAVVAMTVAWQRLDESILRTSAVKQTWERGERWHIVGETVVGGDASLLASPAPVPDAEPAATPSVGSKVSLGAQAHAD